VPFVVENQPDITSQTRRSTLTNATVNRVVHGQQLPLIHDSNYCTCEPDFGHSRQMRNQFLSNIRWWDKVAVWSTGIKVRLTALCRHSEVSGRCPEKDQNFWGFRSDAQL